MEQSLVADGPASTPDNHDNHDHDDHHQDKPQALPLPPVAQQAYDRYGVLDPVKLDLMIRGIFITREYAATLPSRITPDGCPEPSSLHTSHHSRPPRGATRAAATGFGAGAGVWVRESSAAVVAASTAGRSGSDVNAAPSDHEKWGEGEVEMIIRMRAERVGFRYIADRFPSKNQKAVQEKFYKSIKDPRTTRWKRMYHHLRARHDRIHQDQAQAQAHNNLNCGGGGTLEDPIEINSDESSTMVHHKPIEISSGTASEATTTVAEEPEEGEQC